MSLQPAATGSPKPRTPKRNKSSVINKEALAEIIRKVRKEIPRRPFFSVEKEGPVTRITLNHEGFHYIIDAENKTSWYEHTSGSKGLYPLMAGDAAWYKTLKPEKPNFSTVEKVRAVATEVLGKEHKLLCVEDRKKLSGVAAMISKDRDSIRLSSGKWKAIKNKPNYFVKTLWNHMDSEARKLSFQMSGYKCTSYTYTLAWRHGDKIRELKRPLLTFVDSAVSQWENDNGVNHQEEINAFPDNLELEIYKHLRSLGFTDNSWEFIVSLPNELHTRAFWGSFLYSYTKRSIEFVNVLSDMGARNIPLSVLRRLHRYMWDYNYVTFHPKYLHTKNSVPIKTLELVLEEAHARRNKGIRGFASKEMLFFLDWAREHPAEVEDIKDWDEALRVVTMHVLSGE